MGAIFADDHVSQEALQIHDRALRLEDLRQFEMLSKWVLPSDDHSSLRMQCEFAQTCPVAMFEPPAKTTPEVYKVHHSQLR